MLKHIQLRAETFRSPSGLLQLRCDLAQLALRLQAETAQSNFLHPVCDRPDHQLTAEMRGNIGFVETAPLLAKLVDVELGEARERLPAGILVSGGHGRHLSGAVSARASRYTDWPVASLLRITSRPAWRRPVNAARTVCGSQPSRCPISATDAPSGCSSMPISIARFVRADGSEPTCSPRRYRSLRGFLLACGVACWPSSSSSGSASPFAMLAPPQARRSEPGGWRPRRAVDMDSNACRAGEVERKVWWGND